MDSLLQDLRFALRTLARAPGFTAVAMITLAIGIAANTSIFSMVNAVLIQQLPFKDPDHLVRVWSKRPDRDNAPFSLPDYIDYRDQSRSVEQIAVLTTWGVNMTGTGEPEYLQGLKMSANTFQTLGVDAEIGRVLLAEDDWPGSAHVAVISHGLWQRRFGGDRGLIGQTINLNGDAYTVVGVLPSTFLLPGL